MSAGEWTEVLAVAAIALSLLSFMLLLSTCGSGP